MKLLLVLPASLLLSGCVVGTVVDAVTLPVKVASKTVDLATTSQAEADQKRGRELRKEEELRGRQSREMDERCRKGRALATDICTTQRR